MTPPLDSTCQAARIWISAAIDGESGPREREALRTHLQACEACRSWAALAESLSLQVRTAEPVEPPAIVLPAPAKVVPLTAIRSARRRRLALRGVAGVAAVAGVMLIGALLPGLGGSDNGPQQPLPTGPLVASLNNVYFDVNVEDTARPWELVRSGSRESISSLSSP